MRQNLSSKDITGHQELTKNQELNRDLYLKYDLQEVGTEVLIQKYHTSPKKLQKLITAIFKERGFDRSEIESLMKKQS